MPDDIDMEKLNTPEKMIRLRRMMEINFGPVVTKGSLYRILGKSEYIELYSREDWEEQNIEQAH